MKNSIIIWVVSLIFSVLTQYWLITVVLSGIIVLEVLEVVVSNEFNHKFNPPVTSKYNTSNWYGQSYDIDYVDEPGWIAPHNGRCYDSSDDYPRCADGSPDMRYAENYTHDDFDDP